MDTPQNRRMWTRLASAVLVGLLIVAAVLAVVPQNRVVVREGDEAALLSAGNSFAMREQGNVEAELPKSVPIGQTPDESADIEERIDREWARLTYPAGKLPGEWRNKAQAYVQQNVRDGNLLAAPANTNAAQPDVVQPPMLSTWTKIGPAPIDNNVASSGYMYGLVNGRTNAVTIDPRNPAVAYAGTAAGGVWKTTDCCTAATRWTALWDDKNFVTQSASAIEIDPNDSNIVYVGTGDFDARDQFGVGVMKTTDGGTTWTLLGGGPNGIFTPYTTQAHGAIGTAFERPPNENIGSLKVDPRNPNTIFAGTQWGFFMSRDAGINWTQVDVADPTNIQRVSSIVLDASTNPTTMYVALGYPYTTRRFPGITGENNGVYKATIPTSGAPTFGLITTSTNGWPANTGNCVDPPPPATGTPTLICRVGRPRLAVSAQNPQMMYAQVSSYYITETNALGTWLTRDGGSNWLKLPGSEDANYKRNCATTKAAETQDWYDLFIGVDPTNDRTLYIGRTSVYKATVKPDYSGFAGIVDIGSVYGTSCPGYGTIHPDQHAIAMRPDGSSLIGNDGGVYLGAKDAGSGGFTALSNDMNTVQLYAGQLGANFGTTGHPADLGKQYAFGGAQDNGNESWTSANPDLKWQARGNGGDGFFVAFDPIEGTIDSGNWYTEYTYGSLSCSSTGASGEFTGLGTLVSPCAPPYVKAPAPNPDRAQFSTPFTLDQAHCNTTSCLNLILGTNYLYATGSGGMSTAQWVQVSPDLTKGNIGGGATHAMLDVHFAYNNPTTAVVGVDDGNVQWSNNIYTGSCLQALIDTPAFSCTPNRAATWVDLTQGNAVLPNRAIQGVATKADDNQTVYAAVGGFNINTPQTPGHIFQAVCTTGCATATNWKWTDKTGNLPDVPAASVLSNPNNPKQVFAGTYFGFYYTDDITAATPTWLRFQNGLPNTVIQYLTVDRGNTTLGAFTFGRGLYTTKLPGKLETFPGGTVVPQPTTGAGAPTATTMPTSGGSTATPEPTDLVVPPLPQGTPTVGPSVPPGSTATPTVPPPTQTPVPTSTGEPVPPTVTGSPVPATNKLFLPLIQR